MAETLVVFNNIKGWGVPLISRKNFLTVPKLDLNLQQKMPDDVEKKQFAIAEKVYKASFDKEFFSMSNAHFQSIQQLMDRIEEAIEVSKKKMNLTKEALEKMVTAANAKLKAEVDKWKPKVEDLHNKHFEKALATSDAEMKKKVKRAKIKVILVATLVVVLALTAVALTIATAGAGAPLAAAIIGGIVAVVTALVKYQGEFKSAWKLCQDKMAEIKSEVDKSEKIFLELTKLKAKNDQSSLAKAKTFKAQVMLGSGNIEKHVGQLEKFVHNFNDKMKTYKAQIVKLETQSAELKKAGKSTGSQEAEIAELKKLVAEMEKRIGEVAEVRKLAGEITQRLKDDKIPDFPKLRKALDAFGQISAIVNACASSIKSIVGSSSKLKAA
jgi:hypothetical protein